MAEGEQLYAGPGDPAPEKMSGNVGLIRLGNEVLKCSTLPERKYHE